MPDEQTRVDRLIQRHIDFGKSQRAARDWVEASDRPNGDLVIQSRHRADVIITGDIHELVPVPGERTRED